MLNRILIVDDDEDDRFFHRITLEEKSATQHLDEAEDGLIALGYLQAKLDGEHPRPDIIFLDINMPKMNGWEFLEQYKNLNEMVKGKTIVAFLTTSINEFHMKQSKDYGLIDFYFTKPLKPEDVDTVLARINQ